MLQGLRGMPDLFPEDLKKHHALMSLFQEQSMLYGFSPLETPIVEPLETFQRSVGETSDIVSKEMYTLKDRNEKDLCLRPEGTAGLVRAILNAKKQHSPNQKYSYWGPMFRYERPQKGRLRQFHQLGVEHIATESPYADAEIIALAQDFIKSAGIKNFSLELNSLGDDTTRLSHKEALVAYYKKYENDLSEDSKRRLSSNPLRILDSKDPKDQEINKEAPSLSSFMTSEAQHFFDTVCTALSHLNISFSLNPNLVRGLDYYCHTIFEFKSDELGAQGTFLAGGRYDKLAELLGGKALPSIGWAAGIERLALIAKNKETLNKALLVIPGSEEALLPCLDLTKRLRSHSIIAECMHTPSLKAGLKRANKEEFAFALLVGDEELKAQLYTLKNMKTGEQTPLSLEQLISTLS